ncbi:COG3014 family protein [Sphaerochaeta sp.]|uniref:COG3014 family protein n=1 Tax=Sphaerochaeta sp. TaxID=1972642 RepID=UPI002FCBD444
MRYTNKTGRIICFFCITTIVLAGCSSYVDLSNIEHLYQSENYTQAYQSLEQRSNSLLQAQGPIIVNYDLGLLARLDGRYQDSNQFLSEAERGIQEAYTQSISANLASFLVNDNTKKYGGEEYEDLYLNTFKALNYLHLGRAEDALVEINRSLEKHAQLKNHYEQQMKQASGFAVEKGLDTDTEQTYASSFSTSALSNYLGSIIADGLGETNTRDFALQQVRHAFASQPDLYPFKLPRLVEQASQNPTSARLHLVSFNGMAPKKEERRESVFLSPGNHSVIAYPVLVGRPSRIKAVQVTVSQGPTIFLEKLESISAIAIDTFQAKSSLIYLKATLRAMAKAIGVAAYDAIAEQDEQVTATEQFFSFLFHVAQDVTESADIRSTHFLPAEAWVGYVDLAPGTYTVTISFLDGYNQSIGNKVFSKVDIQKGQTNLLESFCPY